MELEAAKAKQASEKQAATAAQQFEAQQARAAGGDHAAENFKLKEQELLDMKSEVPDNLTNGCCVYLLYGRWRKN